MERYSRQLLFNGIGEEGQAKLLHSKVLIVGLGALGTVIANHLARAGVGSLRLVDRDFVEMSNLQRQMLFTEEDAKQLVPKAVAAKQALEKVNSEIEIEAIVENVSVDNIDRLMEEVDVVLDGTDNFETRFLLNDACFKAGIPFSYGGAVQTRGMGAFFIPGETPCLRCFIESGSATGDTCDTVGVLAPIIDIVASLQVIEAMKYLVGAKDKQRKTLESFDIWSNTQQKIKFAGKRADCPTCIKEEFPALNERSKSETTLCGRQSIQITASAPFDLKQMSKKLQQVAQVKETPFLIRAMVSELETIVVFPDGRVLIQGTDDMTRAKTLYSKYIGN
ncbi:ThiF family adenylyltransferase [Shouchella sp. JSM 1781072]|uniref:ThiF family adenylyltransferase n=1 Tax=Bacillaceae TaxID=186817 RepID=UPI000C06A3C8|nr:MULTISPECIES: ThiF family adenylyltransferase [Bacillaceae]UTR07984.1 ThiF family adenylyltransferase [Alkalihalobacillus sp. LMS6]